MSETVSKIEDMKILLVEDQQEARAMIRNMLAELGITQIFEASDGRQAMEFLDSAYDFINVVICDWNMPSMSGLELLKQIRSVDPSIPFLMVTGRGDKGSVIEAKVSGVTAYIRKPFSAKEMEAKLRIIIQKMAA